MRCGATDILVPSAGTVSGVPIPSPKLEVLRVQSPLAGDEPAVGTAGGVSDHAVGQHRGRLPGAGGEIGISPGEFRSESSLATRFHAAVLPPGAEVCGPVVSGEVRRCERRERRNRKPSTTNPATNTAAK
jgi:hypothetical protein